MKYSIQLLTLFLFSNAVLFAQEIEGTVKGNNQFAFEILKEVYSGQQNIFLSPYSISSALAMTYAGARGETENQMRKVLHFNHDQTTNHKAFYEIEHHLTELSKDSGIQLSIANALWKDEEWYFKDNYLNLCKMYYQSSIFPLTTADAINKWVSQKTQHKINDIINETDLNNSRLVLTNAIYFKGDWLHRFDEKDTHKSAFHISDEEKVEVEMMYQKSNFNYFEDKIKQVIELPYQNEALSMMIFLPKPDHNLNEIIQQIDEQSFENMPFKKESAKLFLPKFKFESGFELSKVLTNMGMPDAFNFDANFTGMSPGLMIHKVIHNAFIDVNENGSEAAASTVVVLVEKSANVQKDMVFNANKPFLFLIKDCETKSILFVGSILNPGIK